MDRQSFRITRRLAMAAMLSIAAVTGCGDSQQPDSGNENATPLAGELIESAGVEFVTPQSKARAAQLEKELAPSRHGWQTETLSSAIDAQLKALGKLLAHPENIDKERLDPLVATNVTSGPLRPDDLREVFTDPPIKVFRAESRSAPPITKVGIAGFAEALRLLVQPLAGAEDARSKFKVVTIEMQDKAADTVIYFEASGRTSSGVVQQKATWNCAWHLAEPGKPPKLLQASIEDYEEVVSRPRHGGSLFGDRTLAVLGGNPAYRQQLARGIGRWSEQVEQLYGMHRQVHCGLAVGDVNGDGLEDVYICQPTCLPNLLFVQNPDGTATDVSHQAGVDWLDHTADALFVDLDNDGDQDLVATTVAGLIVMENDRAGKFKRQATLATSDDDEQTVTAVDYDNDGDLDLYVGILEMDRKRISEETSFRYYDARDGGYNLLYRNDRAGSGQWQFTDVTDDCGLGASNYGRTLAAAWEDFDNDGDQDLYVANDFGPNRLYRNDGGMFVDVSEAAGVTDHGSGMSVSWGDYNHDGWMDLYVGNMFSSAGNRITTQHLFKPGVDDDLRALYKRFAKGNTLFVNLGDGTFREIGDEAAVEMGRWAWSSIFADLNNDGWEDLVVANGFITGDNTGDL